MKQEFGNKAPLVRLAFAALSVTLSIGGFIDFLATSYPEVAGVQHGRVLAAVRMR